MMLFFYLDDTLGKNELNLEKETRTDKLNKKKPKRNISGI